MKTAPKQSSLAELFSDEEQVKVAEPQSPVVWPFPRTLHPETIQALPFNLDNFEDALL